MNTLKDGRVIGRVIGLSDDCICLYDSLDDYYNGRDGDWSHVKCIDY